VCTVGDQLDDVEKSYRKKGKRRRQEAELKNT
jgi:hypothetical protein